MSSTTSQNEDLLFDDEHSRSTQDIVDTQVPDEAITTTEELERIRREWQVEKDRDTIFPYRVPEDNVDRGTQTTPSFIQPKQKHRIAIGDSLGLLVLTYFAFTGIIALVRNWPF